MIQKIKGYLFLASSAIMIAVPALVPTAYTLAATQTCTHNIAHEVGLGAQQASGDTSIDCSDTGVGTDSIGKLARNIVNVFSVIVGAVAIIMIIFGGFRYITSGGDSGRVGGAKNTLIYAIVGLIIVALSQLIVHFVLNQAENVTST